MECTVPIGLNDVIDENDYRPHSNQVRAIVQRRIMAGHYAPGERLIERASQLN